MGRDLAKGSPPALVYLLTEVRTKPVERRSSNCLFAIGSVLRCLSPVTARSLILLNKNTSIFMEVEVQAESGKPNYGQYSVEVVFDLTALIPCAR